MNIHQNVRLTPLRREEMARDVVEGRLSKAAAARTYGVTPKVAARWVERFGAEGGAGVADHSSRPKTRPKRTEAAVADAIVVLRRQRMTGKHIAREPGVSEATVSRVQARGGQSQELAAPRKRPRDTQWVRRSRRRRCRLSVIAARQSCVAAITPIEPAPASSSISRIWYFAASSGSIPARI